MTTGALTIQDNDTVAQYTAVGESTFVFTFPILEADELKVSKNQVLQTFGADYSITGLGADGGGYITLLGGPSTPGDIWTLWQDMPIERLTGFSAGAATILGAALNAEFSARLRVEQQLRREIRNSLRLAPDDPISGQDMVLPARSLRAGKYQAYDAIGAPIASSGTGNDSALRTDLATTAAGSQGARLVGTKRSEAGAVARTVFEILTEHASARDFMSADPDGVTDNTAALQNWLNCGAKKLYLPAFANSYRATNLTQRARTQIVGDTIRNSVIRQLTSTTGPLIAVEASVSADISEGGLGWEHLTLQPRAHATSHGLHLPPGVRASMSYMNGLRIHSQQAESHAAVPYAIIAGQKGIYVEDGSTSAIFNVRTNRLEIRGFDAAIYARNVVNDWELHGWLLDNKVGIDIDGCSLWRSTLSHETGVANVCAWRINNCSNIDARMERWELTQTENYGVEFTGGASTYSNCWFIFPLPLIPGDGTTWPGRKYLNLTDGVRGVSNGTLVAGIHFMLDLAGTPLVAGATDTEHQFASRLRAGGSGKGDGRLTIGRDIGGGDCILAYDVATLHHYLVAGNTLRMGGDGAAIPAFKFAVNNTGIGANGTNPIAKPTVTGSRGGNAALASLLTQLAAIGFVTDSSS